MKTEDVLPAKRLGSVVAVAMLERASHAKARVAACQDCCRCVDQLGLSGIGKKGVIIVAKAVSEETLSENRAAALDLMELVLSRMNGDMQRLCRICGSSLSDKARRLIEERWSRRKTNPPASRHAEDSSARRSSKIPTPNKASPSEKNARLSSAASSLAPPKGHSGNGTILQDELPALVLRRQTMASPPAKETIGGKRDTIGGSSASFLPGFSSGSGLNFAASSTLRNDDDSLCKTSAPPLSLPSSVQYDPAANPITKATNDRESFSAAASLRARLLKIREKSKNSDSPYAVAPQDKIHMERIEGERKSVPDPPVEEESNTVPSLFVESPGRNECFEQQIGHHEESSEYILGLRIINGLLSKPLPLGEGDKDLDDGIEIMKKFHGAMSKQQSVVVGLSSEELGMLRQSIVDNIDEMIERLSR